MSLAKRIQSNGANSDFLKERRFTLRRTTNGKIESFGPYTAEELDQHFRNGKLSYQLEIVDLKGLDATLVKLSELQSLKSTSAMADFFDRYFSSIVNGMESSKVQSFVPPPPPPSVHAHSTSPASLQNQRGRNETPSRINDSRRDIYKEEVTDNMTNPSMMIDLLEFRRQQSRPNSSTKPTLFKRWKAFIALKRVEQSEKQRSFQVALKASPIYLRMFYKFRFLIILGIIVLFSFIAVSILDSTSSHAETEEAQKIEVEALKNKYWSKTEDDSYRVVRNRFFSKEHKFELGVFGGSLSADPFFSQKTAGASVGFHLTEYFSVAIVGWKHWVSNSSALTTLENEIGTTVNSNKAKNFIGGEFAYSPLYGKLSLHGALIIYLDLYAKLGLGRTLTESGAYLTPYWGIGQQIFLAKFFALKLDYRMTFFREGIIQKADQTLPADIIGHRTNIGSMISFGFGFLF